MGSLVLELDQSLRHLLDHHPDVLLLVQQALLVLLVQELLVKAVDLVEAVVHLVLDHGRPRTKRLGSLQILVEAERVV